MGPGSRYQIDATIADIYLISDSDRACIIGRPTVYFMIDEFSRMVTGMYVGLENPSYVTSMQVLRIAMCDKVEYCKNFGREIRSEDWPCIGLPEAILADRGELLGHQIEHLEKVLLYELKMHRHTEVISKVSLNAIFVLSKPNLSRMRQVLYSLLKKRNVVAQTTV